MAANLVSLAMQFLTPEMIGRVATALGLDRTLVQSAINAAVPGLLARVRRMSPPNLAARKSLPRRQSERPGRSANLPICLAVEANQPSSSVGRSCSRRYSVPEPKVPLSTRLANLPGSVKARAVRCWGCSLPSSWAQSPDSKALRSGREQYRQPLCQPEGQHRRRAACRFWETARRHEPP